MRILSRYNKKTIEIFLQVVSKLSRLSSRAMNFYHKSRNFSYNPGFAIFHFVIT